MFFGVDGLEQRKHYGLSPLLSCMDFTESNVLTESCHPTHLKFIAIGCITDAEINHDSNDESG